MGRRSRRGLEGMCAGSGGGFHERRAGRSVAAPPPAAFRCPPALLTAVLAVRARPHPPQRPALSPPRQVEKAPVVVKSGVTKAEAEAFAKTLEAAGAKVELE